MEEIQRRSAKRMSIKLGTRNSPLALIQAERVKAELLQKDPSLSLEIVPISSDGDLDKETPLSQLGGKGVFIKRLELALLDQTIDIAVHSLKDVTAKLEDGLELSSFLTPEAIEDCMVFNSKFNALNDFPEKPVFGTGSLRRQALLKKQFPKAQFKPIRGNVHTRLKKLEIENLDAILLSYCGMIRLNLSGKVSTVLDKNLFIPAPGQGVIALETRVGDSESLGISMLINDEKQAQISKAELSFLEAIGLDCGYPLGIVSEIENEWYEARIFITSEDGRIVCEEIVRFPSSEAQALMVQKAEWFKLKLSSNVG